MPSAFGHALVGATLTRLAKSRTQPWRLYFWSVASSIVPDIDVLSFKLGIPYEHPFGHRGFTHSILFALIWALFTGFVLLPKSLRNLGGSALIFVATLSHGVLDAFTNGGLGVGFLIPFNNKRYFFHVRPITVSPVGLHHFVERMKSVIVSELAWIGLPCLAALIAATLFCTRKR